MQSYEIRGDTVSSNFNEFLSLCLADPHHPHIHAVDLPFRLTSSWQDQDCDLAIWKERGELVAWAVFLPAWWNLDYAIAPAFRGSAVEREIFIWGIAQMQAYASRSGESFWGSVEIFEDTPGTAQTIKTLESLGFTPFNWSTLRFELDLKQAYPVPDLPAGYAIRPLAGAAEVPAYVALHRSAFGSNKMTRPWRSRTLHHPAYRPELDLVAVDTTDTPVGFCVCWLGNGVGQIEPLGVHPDHQALGLGQALELTAIERLQNTGADRLRVDHVSLNQQAVTLSKRTGFIQTHNALRYYIEIAPE